MSAVAEKIQSRLEELPAGSKRRRVLECARQFKASWVDLGRLLSEVKHEGLWREWGFPSFDAYCAKELFIRKQTAEKLTTSYRFMERHEPALIRGEEPRPLPSFEVIDVLSRAEAAGRLPDDGWRHFRDEVLERSPTPAALNRQLSERYGAPPVPEPPAEDERLRRVAALAHRLATACAAEAGIPAALTERARGVADDLDELLAG